ncbi:MAG TPA: tetratricopeptide repeat protein, partial [Aggregatilineaceae bacterium]|nr:tetratricopeptide repeat protein [Aggregatilineaceae bacterium]
MTAGNNYFLEQDWEKASAAYARALQEIPDDSEALMGLGIALLELKRYPDALKVFQNGSQIAPENPAFLERTAEVMERLGRLQDGAQYYVQAADVYLTKEHDLIRAIANWEQATRLTPGMLQVHLRLSQAYERTGQRKAAIRQYLIVAFNLQGINDREKALQVIERAKRLEPNNIDLTNAEQALRSGERIKLPDDSDDHGGKRRQVVTATSEVPQAHPEGPLGEATEKALAELAEYV